MFVRNYAGKGTKKCGYGKNRALECVGIQRLSG